MCLQLLHGCWLASHVCVCCLMDDGTPSPRSQGRTHIVFFFGAELRIIAQELGHYQGLRGYLIQTPHLMWNSFHHCVSEILKLQIIKEINLVWQPGMFIYTCIHTTH